MRIVARSTLAAFWGKHAQAEGPLKDWIRVCASARWSTTADIKTAFGSKVDFLPRNRVVFDLGGNKYRLIVVVLLRRGAIYIRFIGTHAEYDRIDASTI